MILILYTNKTISTFVNLRLNSYFIELLEFYDWLFAFT